MAKTKPSVSMPYAKLNCMAMADVQLDPVAVNGTQQDILRELNEEKSTAIDNVSKSDGSYSSGGRFQTSTTRHGIHFPGPSLA